MSKLQAIRIDEDTIIYVEAAEDIATPPVAEAAEETRRGGAKGIGQVVETQMAQSFRAIESTIKTYTKYTLNAFKDASLAEVSKVSLEFGVNVSGVGGVPYIAAGTAGCNIKVSVECVFPKEPPQPVAAQPVAQSAPQPMAQAVPEPRMQPMPQRSPQAVPQAVH